MAPHSALLVITEDLLIVLRDDEFGLSLVSQAGCLLTHLHVEAQLVLKLGILTVHRMSRVRTYYELFRCACLTEPDVRRPSHYTVRDHGATDITRSLPILISCFILCLSFVLHSLGTVSLRQTRIVLERLLRNV